MKIRKGFVSNSSTSSFVCEICGETVAAHDSLSYADIGFAECINGHLFCEEHVCDFETFKREMIEFISEENKAREKFNESIKNTPNSSCAYREEDFLDAAELEGLDDEYSIGDLISEYDYEGGSGVTSSRCPICSFKASSMKDLSRYLLKKYGISRDTVFTEVKKNNKRRKKLYDSEYVSYVYDQFGLTEDIMLKELKDQFGSYCKFKNSFAEVKDED